MEVLDLEKQIRHQPYRAKTYLYAKDPYEAKYQLFINKRESTGLKHDSKAFIEYLNDMDDIYNNIEEYNPNKAMFFLVIDPTLASGNHLCFRNNILERI